MTSRKPAAKFKIRLESGRVLGPLDLARISEFVRQGVIRGNEQAREHPQGDWKAFGKHPELAVLVLAQSAGGAVPTNAADAAGTLSPKPDLKTLSLGRSYQDAVAQTQILHSTQVLPTQPDSAPESREEATKVELLPQAAPPAANSEISLPAGTSPGAAGSAPPAP